MKQLEPFRIRGRLDQSRRVPDLIFLSIIQIIVINPGTDQKRSYSFATKATDGGEFVGRDRFEAIEMAKRLRSDPVMACGISLGVGAVFVILRGLALTSFSTVIGGILILLGAVVLIVSRRY